MNDDLITILQGIYKNSNILSLVYGSNSKTEIDMCVIQPSNGLILNYFQIIENIELLESQFKTNNISKRLFIYDLHKQFAFYNNIPLVHLIYYPSIEYLYYWELSSYIFYIFKKGFRVSGDKKCIKNIADNYRTKSIYSFPHKEYHLTKYAQIALNYYIYSVFKDYSFINLSEAFNKISYSYRYTLNELISSRTIRSYIYDWDEIFKLDPSLCDKSILEVLDIIKNIRDNQIIIGLKDVKRLFIAFCKLYNKCLER